jgi:aspartate racemase
VVAGGIRIGVLGGIGPEATGEFYSKLIAKLQEKGLIKSNKDFPQIVINSIPAPELIYDEISDEELKVYIDGLKELDEFGVDFIVMVCNTIHLYYDKLQREVKTPILNLREEMKEFLRKRGNKIHSCNRYSEYDKARTV